MRLIDTDALMKEYNLHRGDCSNCPHDERGCQRYDWTTQDVCGMLDNAPTIEAIPVDWMAQRMNETSGGTDMNVELNNALFAVGVEWERWKKKHGEDGGGE